MVNVRTRPETGKLYFDFRYLDTRCREYTTLDDTKVNRRRMEQVAEKISAEITLGSFQYRQYFPNSKRAEAFESAELAARLGTNGDVPLFKDFVEIWLAENDIRWRHATRSSTRVALTRHILPVFGDKPMNIVRKPDVLAFRAEMAKLPGRNGNKTLAPKTINNVMGILHMIMAEAGERFGFQNPVQNIKRLKQPKNDINPFTLEEVQKIINTVRPDFRSYFIVRFFTGLRTAEIHGLKWKHVNFETGHIHVRETYARGRTEYTKTDGSQREVVMSSVVVEALKQQQQVTGDKEYVFVTRADTPLDTKNVTDRVWYPLLRHMGLEKRRPYECRHTCATMWLASGESPEWIARQLGHTTTEMLFRVYSRFVPNLTRQDGSAVETLITNRFNLNKETSNDD